MPSTEDWAKYRIARGAAGKIGYVKPEDTLPEEDYVVILRSEYDKLLACKEELEQLDGILKSDWYAEKQAKKEKGAGVGKRDSQLQKPTPGSIGGVTVSKNPISITSGDAA